MPKDLKVLPLTKATWTDLLDLFGKTGGNSQCWCLAYRFPSKELKKIPYIDRKIKLQELTENNSNPPGLIGYINNKPVTWVGFSPKEAFYKLEHSRVIKPIDEKKVWSIACFWFKKDYRGKKLIYQMIEGVINYAKDNNISIIEAYPIELAEGERNKEPPIWFGTRAIFESLGFKKVGETSATSGGKPRVIMRYYT